MKKLVSFALAGIALFSCQNQGSQPAATASAADSSKVATKPEYHYAYTIKHPDNWDIGSQENVVLVLNSLKAFEQGKIDEAMNAFADSVYWAFDYTSEKFSKDSIKATLIEAWKGMASIKVEMEDFESVISKDKSEEFVGLWYKQIITDKKGNADSTFHMDDVAIKNGKIVMLDEKSRRYPKPAKAKK